MVQADSLYLADSESLTSDMAACSYSNRLYRGQRQVQVKTADKIAKIVQASTATESSIL